MKGIMIQGTCSDAGKSYIATALCRVFANKGYQVAPFKSQNMSNNSYVTVDGCEIGRAQGVQAEAAKQEANVHMNPILLKPMKDSRSEVVLHGKVYKPLEGFKYHREFTMTKGMEAIKESLAYLEEHYDMIVVEGAGSPAEVNLNDREIVNMRIAEAADLDVLLVTDIDRGGSFASLVGTLELVFEHRHRIKGVIFNKFRGDISLLQDGLDWFEEYTGVKVVGVIPYNRDLYIETEDAASRHQLLHHEAEDALDIAVIHMERVSNNTDIEPFIYEKDVSVRIVERPEDFGQPHAVIIPGTKSTIGDLDVLVQSGLAEKIIDYAKNGGHVLGICGGYQVLGRDIVDNVGADIAGGKRVHGLGLLPVVTEFSSDKRVRQMTGKLESTGEIVTGYEIHLGQTVREGGNAFAILEDGTEDGCVMAEGQILGTYLHGILNNDNFRYQWLKNLRKVHGFQEQLLVQTDYIKDETYDLLASRTEKYLDMDYIMKLIEG
jgi:adenosylcobyric acid synthase